jgi:tetratricopeptide (TPR) repeat protein
MELILFGAGISVFYYKVFLRKQLSPIMLAGILFVLGYSVFLFLPVRSSAGPMLDWNHPSDLARFWGSITRKTHGGTLDLVSEGYAAGENFVVCMTFYLKHLLEGFFYIGPLLALAGTVVLFRKNKLIFWSLATAWALSGPYFIYKANMPPNPHALAILEAHFILPNVALAIFMGIAIGAAERWVNRKFNIVSQCSSSPVCQLKTGQPANWLNWRTNLVFAVVSILFLLNFSKQLPDLNKRNSFFSYDYAKNVLRSMPIGSVLVMKKDVQLFALWNQKIVEGKRPDLAVISQGLSGSEWYQKTWKPFSNDVGLGPLRNEAEWVNFYRYNAKRKTYFSMDCDFEGGSKFDLIPAGLAVGLNEKNGPGTPLITNRSKPDLTAQTLLDQIYVYRGKYHYGAYKEFFTPDLIDDYSKACFQLGMHFMGEKNYELSRTYFRRALYLNPLFPVASSNISFSYYAQNDFRQALNAYSLTTKQYVHYIKEAVDYNAKPELISALTREYSDAYMSLGVCAERLGLDSEAIEGYGNAITVWPGNYSAYFNRSVVYWKRKDWDSVIRDLETAIKINPNFSEAGMYLAKARQMVGKR